MEISLGKYETRNGLIAEVLNEGGGVFYGRVYSPPGAFISQWDSQGKAFAFITSIDPVGGPLPIHDLVERI